MFMQNTAELILAVCGAAMVYICLLLCRCKKRWSLVGALLSIPVILILVNGATQLVTVDEEQYFSAYTNMKTAVQRLFIADARVSKNLYQYRFTQLTLGNAFAVGNRIFPALAENRTLSWTLYKGLHWLMTFLLLVLIGWIAWVFYMPERVKAQKNQPVVLIASLLLLFLLPANALITKVANYDATSSYASIIGVLLAGGYWKTRKRSTFYGALTFACLGAMEKISSAPWYYLSVVLLLAGGMLSYRRDLGCAGYKRALWFGFLCDLTRIVVFSFLLSGLSLLNIYVLTAKESLTWLTNGFTFATVAFPFVSLPHMLLSGGMSLDHFIVARPALLGVATYAVLGGCAWFTQLICVRFAAKPDAIRFAGKVFSRGMALLIVLVILASVAGAYLVAERNSAFIGIDHEAYVPDGVIGGGAVYHYGAGSWLTHILSRVLYTLGTNIVSVPTSIVLLMLLAAVLIWRKPAEESELLSVFLLCIAVLTPVLFAVAGQPSSYRYYVTPMLLQGIFAGTLLCGRLNLDECPDSIRRCRRMLIVVAACAGVSLALTVAEMIPYAPNVMCFSPFWLVRDQTLLALPEQGKWHPGETMCWGEQNWIASKMIEQEYGSDQRAYRVYTDYGEESIDGSFSFAIGCPRATIHTVSDCTPESFDADSWFILSRFRVYRSPLPDYLTEVEPEMKLMFRGMTAVWIYRGDQLAAYCEEIVP